MYGVVRDTTAREMILVSGATIKRNPASHEFQRFNEHARLWERGDDHERIECPGGFFIGILRDPSRPELNDGEIIYRRAAGASKFADVAATSPAIKPDMRADDTGLEAAAMEEFSKAAGEIVASCADILIDAVSRGAKAVAGAIPC